MSAILFPDDVLFFQRLLKIEGLYKGKLDGIWGPLTEKGSNKFESMYEKIKKDIGTFDLRTEKNILTLTLKAQKEARKFMVEIENAGINAKIISGTRTYVEQNRLYRQGRFGNPGKKVTNAIGGRSNHNFGIAWDIGIFSKQGGFITKSGAYDEPASVGLTNSLEWGGHWKSFVDKPHYQLKVEVNLKIVRKKFEAGEPFTAFA